MKRNLLISIIVLTFAIVGLLTLQRNSSRSILSPIETNSLADVSAPEDSSVTNSRDAKINVDPDFAKAAADQNKLLEKIGVVPGMTREQMERKHAEWYLAQLAKSAPEEKPIEFFGKVVDAQMQPVADAKIHFIWSHANGTSEKDAFSARDGSFSLTGVTGNGVTVYPSKDGYRVAKSLNQVHFDPTGDGSNRDSPVLFHIRKIGSGVELITSRHGVFPELKVAAPLNGSPVRVDFFQQKFGSEGQLEVSQVKPPRGEAKNATQWSFHLAIPDGGLIEHHDEFPFEAPATGYRASVDFHFTKDSTNWSPRISKSYYVVFGNPRRYGLIHVETSITSGINLEYAINPDGSRNLEPK